MSIGKFGALAGAAVFACAAQPAMADVFILTTNGGNGTISTGPAPYDFTLTGSDGVGGNIRTLFTATAERSFLFTGNFSYSTADEGGSYDPAGFILNGSTTRLSNDFASANSGSYSYQISAGDIYGFYVDNTDGCCGAGSISFNATSSAGGPGAPAPIIGLGAAPALASFAGLGLLRTRRRKRAKA